MEHKNEKKKANKMGSPPYYDATPTRMGRSAGKGASGDSWRVPNGAKYGLGEGKQPTRMDRSVGKGKGGGGDAVRPEAKGPAKSSRKDSGANTTMGKSYGVGGVSLKDGDGRYGV